MNRTSNSKLDQNVCPSYVNSQNKYLAQLYEVYKKGRPYVGHTPTSRKKRATFAITGYTYIILCLLPTWLKVHILANFEFLSHRHKRNAQLINAQVLGTLGVVDVGRKIASFLTCPGGIMPSSSLRAVVENLLTAPAVAVVNGRTNMVYELRKIGEVSLFFTLIDSRDLVLARQAAVSVWCDVATRDVREGIQKRLKVA